MTKLEKSKQIKCIAYNSNGEKISEGHVREVITSEGPLHPWTTLHNAFFVDGALYKHFLPGTILALPKRNNYACQLVAEGEPGKYPPMHDGVMIDNEFKIVFAYKK